MLGTKVCYLLLTVILLSTPTLSTKSCNVYNTLMEGAYTCGLDWWTKQDLGQVVSDALSPNSLSNITTHILEKFGLDFNSELNGQIGVNSTDPLAKIIESGIIAEPFVAFAVFDAILGMEINATELQLLGLPTDLVKKDVVIDLMEEYMDSSCSENYGVGSFVTCMETWIVDNNCTDEDQPEVLKGLLDNFNNFYCKDGKAKPEVLSKLNDTLGTVFKPVLNFLGVVKGPKNQYYFNLTKDSIIFNEPSIDKIVSVAIYDCGYFIHYLLEEGTQMISEENKIGSGVVLKTLRRSGHKFGECMYRGLKGKFADLFASPELFDQLNMLLSRYGVQPLVGGETEVGATKRSNVFVFGDPHIRIYNSTTPVTCSALGWNNYLTNEFFVLTAYAESAAENSQASYVTKIKIDFRGENEGTTYTSYSGEKPHVFLTNGNDYNLTSKNQLKVTTLKKGVVIRDIQSGAAIGIIKYKDTYSFALRSAGGLFEGSLGMLVEGCPGPIATSAWRKRSAECDAACADAPSLYMETCLFDCDITGDTEVGAITRDLEDLQSEVEAVDQEILILINGETTTYTDSDISKGSRIRVTTSVGAITKYHEELEKEVEAVVKEILGILSPGSASEGSCIRVKAGVVIGLISLVALL